MEVIKLCGSFEKTCACKSFVKDELRLAVYQFVTHADESIGLSVSV